MIHEDAIARGHQAQLAMEWLGPAFAIVTADYLAKLQEVAASEPWATDKIRKLAMATKIAREVEAQIKAVVATGEKAKADKKRADGIAALPDEKRKWALMGGIG